MKNEHELQQEIKKYLQDNNWEIKEYVKREDTKNWEHSYEADLIIKHEKYPKLGWIGIELKNENKSKTPAIALKQIITKYQNHYFENITQPIHCWIIITNQLQKSSNNIGNPYITNYENAFEVGYLRVCQQFGVGFFDWKSRHKNPRTESYNGPYGPYSKQYYNLIDLRSEAPNGKICLENEGMLYYKTDEDAILNFLKKRIDWTKYINLKNMKFLGDSNE
jgi:hypothetical protein